jgi:hypothetical protein
MSRKVRRISCCPRTEKLVENLFRGSFSTQHSTSCRLAKPSKQHHLFKPLMKTNENQSEKKHWKKYNIWKTNPYNVENIKAAIKHLRKTGEEKTTKNYYSFK